MTAIEYLSNVKTMMADQSLVDCSIEERRALVSLISDDLAQYDPFKRVEEGWLSLGDGGGRACSGISGSWAVRQLLSGKSPADIVGVARQQIDANSMCFQRVTVIKGAKVDRHTKLAEGVWISPSAEVSGACLEEYPTNDIGICASHEDEYARLIEVYSFEPMLVSAKDEAAQRRQEENYQKQREARDHTRDQIRRAITMSTLHRISMDVSVTTGDEASILCGGSVEIGLNRDTLPFGIQELNPEQLMTTIRHLQEFKSPESLHLSIDRLASARLSHDQVDQAIDLGIAAEIALMHGEADGPGEISHKIGLRAGWLLGSDVRSRMQFKRSAAALYSARSNAAHTGKLADKALKTYSFGESNQLVAQLLTNLLVRGSFPNWSELVFGGLSNPQISPDYCI